MVTFLNKTFQWVRLNFWDLLCLPMSAFVMNTQLMVQLGVTFTSQQAVQHWLVVEYSNLTALFTKVSFVFLFSSTLSSLHADGFSGTAGKTSSLTHTGSQFSTKDRDNDRCTCKCAQLASGGANRQSSAPIARPRLSPSLFYNLSCWTFLFVLL